MRFRTLLVVASLWAVGCGGDDSSGRGDGGGKPSIDAGRDTLLPDGQIIHHDGDSSYVITADGAVVVVHEPDAAVADATIGTFVDAYVPDNRPLSAGFSLASPTGDAPLFETAHSTATGAVETLYTWGEGSSTPDATATHRYDTPGTYTVTQTVKDKDGKVLTATASVTVSANTFVPVKLSATDHTVFDDGVVRWIISPDGLEVEQTGWQDTGGRVDTSIAPGSGIFYVETHFYADVIRRAGLGIGTAAVDFNEEWKTPTAESVTMGTGDGSLNSAGGTCTGPASPAKVDRTQHDIGMVVDYRAATPIVYFVQDAGGTTTVVGKCTSSITAPVFWWYGGGIGRVGNVLRINAGADTTNLPFHYSDASVRAAVSAAGDAAGAAAIQMGFGKTRARPVDSAPVLTTSADVSVPLGQAVTLTGSASDAEEGDLSAAISWLDISGQRTAQPKGTGASFTFTPAFLGKHPIIAKVKDSYDVVTTKTVTVTVTGALQSFNPVQLVRNDLTGTDIITSPDMLSAQFGGYFKSGIRANQGIYGNFWYFEVQRFSHTRNMGMGLIIEDGALNPYDYDKEPWSCSINVKVNGGGTYINLIPQGEWPNDESDTFYGFAVDYRGDHPLVYVIIHGTVQATYNMVDTWVPLYPLVYGNGPDDGVYQAPYDYSVNFGAAGPGSFNQPVKAALQAANIDASGLKLGWGVNAQ